MQTSQIKEKLVQMLDVVSSIEKVEMELRAILGPINQWEVQKPIVKAKPRLTRHSNLKLRANKGWQTRANGVFSRDNIKKAISKIWYYTKENTNTFSPKEITILVGIESSQQPVLWKKIGQELALDLPIVKRAPNQDGKYRYKLTEAVATKIKKLLA